MVPDTIIIHGIIPITIPDRLPGDFAFITTRGQDGGFHGELVTDGLV